MSGHQLALLKVQCHVPLCRYPGLREAVTARVRHTRAGAHTGRRRRDVGPRGPRNFGVLVWVIFGVVVVVAVIAAVKVSGIASDHHPAGAAETPVKPIPTQGSTPRVPPQAGSVPSTGPDIAALRDAFAQLQSRIAGTIGIAIAPAGSGASPIAMGQWMIGPAWSTIKVPLVTAALRDEDSPAPTDEMRAAITGSDNAAAESIWDGLGDPVTAAHRVEQVLIEAGDPTTVQSQRVRPPFTAFGQTHWSLVDQTRFAAFAACDERDKPVRTLMGEIQQDQRWGLGVIPNTEFKGGWGPNEAGNYLVRQFGFVTNPSSGAVSIVAVAVEPASGSFADGTADLTKMGNWLNEHIAMLPAGQCGR